MLDMRRDVLTAAVRALLPAISVLACAGCRADAPATPPPAPAQAAEVAEAPVAADEEPDPCAEGSPLDVLFVGNSYLNLHDLPVRVSQLGEAAGIPITVDKVTMGGESFEYHLGRPKTAAMLEDRDWDAVVLQSHSLDPLRNHDGFVRAGAALGDKVRAAGAEPVLFETWARRAGHNLYNYMDVTGGNPKAMQQAVTARYASLAEAEGMRVAPVGTAWMAVHDEHADIDLFAKDGGHPSAAGAYLGACVVFSSLTDHAPVDSGAASEGLDDDVAATLRAVATAVVRPTCASPDPVP